MAVREIKYFIIEETETEVNIKQVLGYRKAMEEYKRLKREHPENTYRLEMR